VTPIKLTDEQRAVCAAIGVSEEAFAKALVAPPAHPGLTDEQRAVCAAIGVSEEAFHKTLTDESTT